MSPYAVSVMNFIYSYHFKYKLGLENKSAAYWKLSNNYYTKNYHIKKVYKYMQNVCKNNERNSCFCLLLFIKVVMFL